MANRKRNISFNRPEEPEFIKKLKARAGITYSGPDINTKTETLPQSLTEDLEDKDEEQPVIVVLKDGDMTEEEVTEFTGEQNETKEINAIKDGKIVFKKPDKSCPKSNDLSINSNKKQTLIKQKFGENSVKSVKNSRLLSFGDEEEEEYSD